MEAYLISCVPFPFQEYARMVQMLQGYCIICTGVRITCYCQNGKGFVEIDYSGTPLLYLVKCSV